jgi:hypothetical protein
MVIRTITGGTDETVTASGVANPPFAPGGASDRIKEWRAPQLRAIPGRRYGWRHDEGMSIRPSAGACAALDVAVGGS